MISLQLEIKMNQLSIGNPKVKAGVWFVARIVKSALECCKIEQFDPSFY